MIKNAFYFTCKISFCTQDIEIFVLTFGHVEKWFDKKDNVTFKISEVTAWFTNNGNAHIPQYLTK